MVRLCIAFAVLLFLCGCQPAKNKIVGQIYDSDFKGFYCPECGHGIVMER